jgi:hypothetical protein
MVQTQPQIGFDTKNHLMMQIILLMNMMIELIQQDGIDIQKSNTASAGTSVLNSEV